MTAPRALPGSWIATGWALVYLSLGGIIGLELDWGRSIRPPLPEPAPMPEAHADYPIQPEFFLPPLQQGFAETTARPVFTVTRRPPPIAAVATAMQKGQFILLGSLITGDKKIAMLREAASGKTVRIEQGNTIRGIMLSEVYPEKVVLTQDGDTEELPLKIQSAAKLPVAPKAAPAQPVPPQPVPGTAAASPGATPAAPVDPQSMINRRRAARGLPPL